METLSRPLKKWSEFAPKRTEQILRGTKRCDHRREEGKKRKKGTIDSWTGAYIEIYRGVGGGMTDLGVTISLLNKKKMYI